MVADKASTIDQARPSEPTLLELQRAEINRAIGRLTVFSELEFKSELYTLFADFHGAITALMFGRDGKPVGAPGHIQRPWIFSDERLAERFDKRYWALMDMMLDAKPVRDESAAEHPRRLLARMDEPGFKGFGVKTAEVSHA